jgi:small subunit ribosomal protein S16
LASNIVKFDYQKIKRKQKMLKIRLSRVGKKNSPIFRLVVAEKSRAVKREYIEILGLYKPTEKENKFQCKKDRIEFWMKQGAQPSETVNNLLCDFGVLAEDQKVNIVYGKKLKKKDLKKEASGGDVKPAESGVVVADESKETTNKKVSRTENAKSPEKGSEEDKNDHSEENEKLAEDISEEKDK